MRVRGATGPDSSVPADADREVPEGTIRTCPACGSRRAYRAEEPALPDPESEAYVKLDADAAEGT